MTVTMVTQDGRKVVSHNGKTYMTKNGWAISVKRPAHYRGSKPVTSSWITLKRHFKIEGVS